MAGELLMRSDFEALATPAAGNALRLLFEDGDADIIKVLDKLYNVETTDEPFKMNLSMSGIGLLRRLPEGNNIRYDKFRQGRARAYFGDTFNIAVGYTRPLKRADRTGTILREIPKELKKAYQQTREIAGSLRYLNGFTVQGDEPDGVAWFSTAHPVLRAIDSTTTWSNRSSTDASLSYTSLRQARTDMQLTVSDSGRKDPIIATELLVGPSNEAAAYELTASTLIPGATPGVSGVGSQQQNTRSFVNGVMRLTTPVLNPYWGTSFNWFLRRPLKQIHIHWYDFMEDVYDTYMDFRNKTFWQDISCEFGFGADDMRGAYGSAAIA